GQNIQPLSPLMTGRTLRPENLRYVLNRFVANQCWSQTWAFVTLIPRNILRAYDSPVCTNLRGVAGFFLPAK
ncbi:MAG: hypothetical protein ACRC38_11860, partial [Plesiomonas sp.]